MTVRADTFPNALARVMSDPTVKEAFERQESQIVDELCKLNPFDREREHDLVCQLRATRAVRTAPARHKQRQRLQAVNDG